MTVDPRSTSRQCPACRHTAKENRPAQDTFHCTVCGHTAHADTVGALNVVRAGPSRSPTGITRPPFKGWRSHAGADLSECLRSLPAAMGERPAADRGCPVQLTPRPRRRRRGLSSHVPSIGVLQGW
ncbi:zinc ribbon domain-containing protein [Streptomyces sp. NBC_01320]